MKVWVLVGRTESGDNVGPYVWDRQPSDTEIVEVLRADWPEEFEAFGCDGGISWDLGDAWVIR
ncbi:hypothetical protein [Rhizobium rhizogenes]|uniref:hypothetical protein n=1 Tax=Rhizobium rhizogenes TaxID=359 RepID=UPI001574B94C|nr:hypothetical protein [Rhizobium rhizogenes]NTH18428.1 hypothetical protein [Rhizobium rhizogenes]NTH31401.1 hypothetical protein [Rhizobium rhizogenes]